MTELQRAELEKLQKRVISMTDKSKEVTEPSLEISIDDEVSIISSTGSKGDLTSTEVKTELHISNPKFFDLLNKGELEAYYAGTQLRVKRSSVIGYKERHAYIPRKSA
jgi:excisionase family DNA binding protein